MDKKLLKYVLFPVAVLALAACSEESNTLPPEGKAPVAAKEPAAAPVPVAALTAFWEMYKPARTWAADVLPLSLASGEIPGIANVDGKAAQWTAVFVSPAKREARTFFYAVADQGSSIHKGVSIGGAQSWSGATPKSKPFAVSEFSVNSDAAFKTALEKAGPWLKSHPNKKAGLFLAAASRFPAPVWYIIWGDKKAGYGAFINATTGAVMNVK